MEVGTIWVNKIQKDPFDTEYYIHEESWDLESVPIEVNAKLVDKYKKIQKLYKLIQAEIDKKYRESELIN